MLDFVWVIFHTHKVQLWVPARSTDLESIALIVSDIAILRF